MTEEQIKTEEVIVRLFTEIADVVTKGDPTPENVAAAMLATSHVLVSLSFAAFEEKDRALEMIAQSIEKAVARRKYAMEYQKKGQTENEKKKENQST